MGVALEWEPWNWDLWLEPDDDEANQELFQQKLDEALEAECEGDHTLADKLLKVDS